MKIIYQIGIALYVLAIRIAANFNHKAKLWLAGRENIFESIALSLEQCCEAEPFSTGSGSRF